MEYGLKKRMELFGVAVDEAIERFMGNEALFKKYFCKFRQDKNYENLVNALNQGYTQEAFIAAHSLKGVCGNLSMVRLEEEAGRMVEFLRQGEIWKAKEALCRVQKAYDEIIRAIDMLEKSR